MGNYLEMDSFLSFKAVRHLVKNIKGTVEGMNKYQLPPLLLVAQGSGDLEALDMTNECISESGKIDISPLFSDISKAVQESHSPVFALMFLLPSKAYQKKKQENELIATHTRPSEYNDQMANTIFAMYYLDEFNRKLIIQDFVFTEEDGFQWELPDVMDLSEKEEISPSKWWNWNEVAALNLLALS